MMNRHAVTTGATGALSILLLGAVTMAIRVSAHTGQKASVPASARGTAPQDPRLQRIADAELTRLIRSLPLADPRHHVLLSRAAASARERVAYREYEAHLAKAPTQVRANLLCGIAAELYLESLTHPDRRQGRRFTAEESRLTGAAHDRAADCLRKATELDPNFGLALSEYGHFRFFREGRRAEGLRLLSDGALKDAKNPRTRRLLADVLATPWAGHYDPVKAEREYAAAARLDETYAAPHWGLAELYFNQGRFEDAERELSAYLKRAPQAERQKEKVVSLREAIKKKERAR